MIILLLFEVSLVFLFTNLLSCHHVYLYVKLHSDDT